MSLTKHDLRQLMSVRLRQLPAEQAAEWSARVIADLEALPAFMSARTILLYYSLPTEVDTHPLLQRWCETKCLLLPVVVGNDLELRRYTGPRCLSSGAFGILEPVGPAFTDLTAIDMVVVPGVAFDAHGGRLGHGKGYYDRLLPHIPHALKVGICYPFQVVEAVPTDDHDAIMDCVLTTSLNGIWLG